MTTRPALGLDHPLTRGAAVIPAASARPVQEATMSDPAYLPARFTRAGDRIVAELAVTLDNPVHEVWAALTEPDRLAQWLAPGRIELREGGVARLDFADSGIVIDSTVTAVEPMRRLEY